MKLTEQWKNEMFSMLMMIYGNRLNPDKLKLFLDSKVANANVVTLKCRNVYKGTHSNMDGDTIFETVETNNFVIGANGGYCEAHNVNLSPVSRELIRMKADRKKYKQLGIKSDDPDVVKFYDNLQTHIKQNTNAFYGIQLQPGSFLYNPDSASLITLQARQLISEMMWTLERVLEGNPQYTSMNECMLSIKKTLEWPFTHAYSEIVSYEPSDKEFRRRFIEVFSIVPNFKEFMKGNSKSFFIFMKSLTKMQRIKFYYSNNLEGLLKLNPKALKIIIDIVSEGTPFMSPSDVPAVHKDNLNLIMKIIEEYVYNPISNAQRVFKYENKMRKSIVVSDTDSVMINLGNWVHRIIDMGKLSIDAFHDENKAFTIVNTFAYICTKASELAAKTFCNQCRIPPEYHNLIEMKNEYLFKRLINYADTKKSYAAHIRLREGTVKDDMEWKGTKLVSSALSPLARELVHDLIETDILKTKDIDPLFILQKVKAFENKIRSALEGGDLTLGKSSRFSGENYADIFANAAGRSALIWNILYPDDPINDGEYGWLFDCTIRTLEDCEKIKTLNPEMYEKVKTQIFNSTQFPRLARFGISMISVPKEGDHDKIPEWIRSILDYDSIINKHLQPLASLLPSIGVYRSRISSTRYNYSPLLRF